MSEAWKSDPGMSSIQIMEKETHTEGGGRKKNRMFKNPRMFKIASFIQQKKAFTRTEGKEFSAGITEVRSYKWYFMWRNRNLYLLWKTWTFLLSCLTQSGLVTAVFMCIIIAKWKRRKQWIKNTQVGFLLGKEIKQHNHTIDSSSLVQFARISWWYKITRHRQAQANISSL